ncbi:MAG: dihydropteroate synthase [Firmicutes bacterium]|nr:dihydropteroate synthase [Bacillota bacterium]
MFDIFSYLRDFHAASPCLLMGILNLTPDSFHDGACYNQKEKAIEQLLHLRDAGAQIVDLGAMSSRPGHAFVTEEEEISRLALVLEQEIPDRPLLSVDTDKPEVAAYALEQGVQIINDCSGLLQADMYRLAARKAAPLIVMHRQGEEGRHTDICREVQDFFRECIAFGKLYGVQERQLILDPGLGFNKSIEENLQLMAALPEFSGFGLPVLLGFSHKRFVSGISGEPPAQSPGGNLAAAVYGFLHGASILRMHDLELLKPLLQAAAVLWKEQR